MDLDAFIRTALDLAIADVLAGYAARREAPPDDDKLADIAMSHPLVTAVYIGRKAVESAVDEVLVTWIAAGEFVPVGNGGVVLAREHYRPEIHGPAVPYQRLVPVPT